HVLENLLDKARHHTLALNGVIIDTLLQSRDVLQDQLNAYRSGDAPDEHAAQALCQRLEQLGGSAGAAPAPVVVAPVVVAQSAQSEPVLALTLLGVSAKDRQLLLEELALLGKILGHEGDDATYQVLLETSTD